MVLQELDIIKLTAQFVALNGSSFLSGLKSREENKREFHFLKENHSLNLFFKRLTDAYSAVRLDSKDSLVRLREDSTDSNAVLQRCAHSNCNGEVDTSHSTNSPLLVLRERIIALHDLRSW